jgi:3'-phosphoadenosine 5'-phosphosulfate sulfotransferase (PAPS reductase)/FAD synthetase
MSNPFEILEPTCISFSGGRTSAYMLWRVLQAHDMSLPEDCVVCFANTGKEDEATLKFVHDCETNWNVPIVWLEYIDAEETKDRWKQVTYETASRNGEPFEAMIARKNFLPNSVMRFCTTELKIVPIAKYMESIGHDEFETFAGIRADEPKRVAKLRQSLHAPLATSGITQADVQSFWKENDFDLGLDFQNKVTALGNCDLCFMKGGSQIMSIIQHQPERAVWWAKQEEKINGRFSKDRASYAEMMKFAQEQTDFFTADDETIPCFCGD